MCFIQKGWNFNVKYIGREKERERVQQEGEIFTIVDNWVSKQTSKMNRQKCDKSIMFSMIFLAQQKRKEKQRRHSFCTKNAVQLQTNSWSLRTFPCEFCE